VAELQHEERPALVPEVADAENLLEELDACGVGLIASLRNEHQHRIVEQALTALGCMEHRGACSADDISGDGAGIMTKIPWQLFKAEMQELKEETTGVGMMFIPNDDALEAKCKEIFEAVAKAENFKVVGWRDVPVDTSVVGPIATKTMPRIRQVFIESNAGLKGDELERELFIVRKLMEKEKAAALGEDHWDFYACSLSNRTIVYKGMLNSAAVGPFFKDLTNPAYATPFAIYHRRFSTNTTPKWPLAQPMRVLGHNGEINTLQGNLNWVASRQAGLRNEVWRGREHDFLPLCSDRESDSANLDHVAELMVRSGTDPQEALMALVPEAYRNHPDLVKNYPEVVDFYEYYEGLQEGWDGPALLVFSDGKKVGCRLDRNGLRPARFWQTKDDMVYVASEVGVLGDVLSNAENIVAKGRLGPGQMVCADLTEGTFRTNTEIARDVATRAPYAEWVKSCARKLSEMNASKVLGECQMDASEALRLQAAMGYGLEDTQMIIESMAQTAAEPTFCMGDDVPLPVLAGTPHMLYDYFKQRFAQVTNPPIDPLREGLVMSLEMRLGGRGNLLQPGAGSYNQIMLKSPVLLESELDAVRNDSALNSQTFSLHYTAGTPHAMADAIKALCTQAEAAVRAGCGVVVLSDKGAMQELSPPIPPLLATGAVHHHLIKAGLRTETSIVVETAQCFSTHHVAMLVGYGAHAVCPYLAFETCRQWRASPRTENLIKAGKVPDVTAEAATSNYKKALEKGILKILSKMGISLLSCYHGAQIFEVYGLGKEVIDTAFCGSVSRIGGMSLADIQRETEAFWAKGFPDKALTKLDDYGFIQSRPKGEYHANNQAMAKLLHKAIGLGGQGTAGQAAYDAYTQHFRDAPVHVLRDMLELKSGNMPIPIEEVEPAADIMSRFCTGGMSLGAISRETHETIAIAVNRIGGKSNSGEGGEDPVRWQRINDVDAKGKSATFSYLRGLQNGDIATSRIKQVASGRFGVTPEFLVNAEQLEIKIAQGAKPGEGGQLPGKKVSPYIAGMRRSKPGVPLISPPPHHDIYSIEDLAQLICDLHQVNEQAKVSVKLVAQAGIGTVASGVAKANADIIQISGHDGGTGASPISSIKHCGGPIEMGLAEVHQTLTTNGLRERVALRADGGMRSGRDILVTAALGADEYGFGTVAMIATGCIMARVCHTNNCPVGVASQREELRARFPGAPDDLVNYFHFVAEEVRAGLAALGLRSMDELIGRADLLRQRSTPLAKTSGLDLSFLTTYAGETGASTSRLAQEVHSNGPQLDDRILADADVQACIANSTAVTKEYEIVNVDRSALGRVGGAIARKYGDSGFTGTLALNLRGSAGQSFACFTVNGMVVRLVGEANDYVGKGMAGGDVTIVPPPGSTFAAEKASIVGNTCLYGATGGRLFVGGRAGERFAVRNSRAEAVVEGTGDHCCEYMTGGTVVALGQVGRNVAAGMTGGLGYFFDEEGDFPSLVNSEIVAIQRVQTAAGEAHLRGLIEAHVERTGSAKGKAILADWSNALPKFWQLVPPSEANSPQASKAADEAAQAGGVAGVAVAASA
jgi:glutamate synthase (ferredoxin)